MYRAALLASLLIASCGESEPADREPPAAVHVFTSEEAAIAANAYIVETDRSLILIDATLTESSSSALRARIDALDKPLAAVFLTHGHPDHYNGLTNVLRGRGDIPVYAAATVDAVIRRDDAAKERQWRATFGAEWPNARTFANRIVSDGEEIDIDGVTLTLRVVGEAESDADTLWLVGLGEGTRVAFIGDLAFNGMHAYTCDGHLPAWRTALARLTERARAEAWSRLYPGHGPAGGSDMLRAQDRYLAVLNEQLRTSGDDGALDAPEIAAIQATLEAETGVEGLGFLVGACAPALMAAQSDR